MRTSENGLSLIKAFEGCVLSAYKDSVGVPTIGYGHTNAGPPKFKMGDTWTREQADAALASDLTKFERHVLDYAAEDLEQYEFDALVSWAFNTGGPASATLWKKLSSGQKAAVPSELLKWDKAGGRTLAGLTRRRKAEALMFEGKVAEALALAGVKKPPTKPIPKPEPAPVPPPPDVEPTPKKRDRDPFSPKALWRKTWKWIAGGGAVGIGAWDWRVVAVLVVAGLVAFAIYRISQRGK